MSFLDIASNCGSLETEMFSLVWLPKILSLNNISCMCTQSDQYQSPVYTIWVISVACVHSLNNISCVFTQSEQYHSQDTQTDFPPLDRWVAAFWYDKSCTLWQYHLSLQITAITSRLINSFTAPTPPSQLPHKVAQSSLLLSHSSFLTVPQFSYSSSPLPGLTVPHSCQFIPHSSPLLPHSSQRVF